MGVEVRQFRAEDETALRRVMLASLTFDAFPGFTAWDLDIELASILGDPQGTAVALDYGVLCGYVSPRADDLTVHPESRRRGHGRRLFAAGMEIVARTGEDEICLYVPETGAGQAFAAAMGLAYRSILWRLELSPTVAIPDPAFSKNVVGRTFGDWITLPRYADLLNDSFAGHPSPLSWTVGRIEYRHSRPDFDPTSIFVLTTATSSEQPIGFVRIALGPPEDGGAPVGEVELVGVVPQWRGRGLGRELLRWGVAQLRSRGAERIQLTVEARNELALGLYRRTGFERAVKWPHWTRSVAANVTPQAADPTAGGAGSPARRS
jgi:mycothiol synthase